MLVVGWLVLWGHPIASIDIRFILMRFAASHLTLFGNGPFMYIGREPHVHNDWLQWLYELGAIGAVPLILAIKCAERTKFAIALLVLASIDFPLHEPAAAWFSAIVLGYFMGRGKSDGRTHSLAGIST